MNRRFGSRTFDIINISFFVIVGFLTLYPFWNILVLSFNDATDAMTGGIYLWPREFSLSCYQYIFTSDKNLPIAFFNSVLRTVLGTALSVLSTTLVSYVLSRKDFVARRLFSTLFIISMYFSGGLIPFYILIKQLHLMNNFLVYIIPPFMSTPGLISAFYLIIMRTFIQDIPPSLQEAASVDGANDFQIFAKIIFPLCKPVVATIALFIAVAQWSSWQDTYFFTSMSPNLTTLQFEMVKIITQASSLTNMQYVGPGASQVSITPTAIQDCIIIIATVPILVIYPFLQKYFVTGLTIGAVKE